MKKNEIQSPKVSVKLVRDGHGNAWLCDASVSGSGDLASQGCTRADDVIYDRSFGG